MAKKKKSAGKRALPQRGMWSGAISFGLVNISVRLVSGKERQDLHFHLLDASDLGQVGYKYYNKKTGEEVSHSHTVKAYEYKADNYVVMTDADFKKANPKATQTIDIEDFVDPKEIDPVFYDRAYYLLPNKGGEKGYALLCEALRHAGKIAIAKIVLHTKQHLVALIPRGDFLLCETLHFAEDVRELRDLGAWEPQVQTNKKASSREVEMAEKLIENMTGRWDPDQYHDTYREDILKRVKAKVKAGKATEVETEPEEKAEKGETVFDLMPLLKQSLSRGRSLKDHGGKRSQR